jgi:hypothetical protein
MPAKIFCFVCQKVPSGKLISDFPNAETGALRMEHLTITCHGQKLTGVLSWPVEVSNLLPLHTITIFTETGMSFWPPALVKLESYNIK